MSKNNQLIYQFFFINIIFIKYDLQELLYKKFHVSLICFNQQTDMSNDL